VQCSFAVGAGFGPANHGEPPKTPAGHIFDCTHDILVPIARIPQEGLLASFRPRAGIVYAEFALPLGRRPLRLYRAARAGLFYSAIAFRPASAICTQTTISDR
jgi:hypothetical protein